MNKSAKVVQPIACLPAFPVVALVLAFHGYLDEAIAFLLALSRAGRTYIKSSHLHFLRHALVHSKFIIRSHGLPNALISKRVKRSPRISRLRSSGTCNTVRMHLMDCFGLTNACTPTSVLRLVVTRYVNDYNHFHKQVCAVLLHRSDYCFQEEFQ